jgi:hypothetical protein
MQSPVTKDSALDEVRKTVTFLLLESRKGREEIELDFLLNNNVENNIIRNFGGMLNQDEYEEIVRELFEKGDDLYMGDVNPQDVIETTMQLMNDKQYRNSDTLLKKILSDFSVAPDDRQAVSDIVTKAFQAKADEDMKALLARGIQNGVTDDKALARQAKALGYDLPPAEILKEIKTQRRVMREQESQHMKSQLLQRRQRRPGPAVEETKGASSAARKIFLERRKKSIAESLLQNKARFIQTNCDNVEFSMLENMAKDDKRIFLHRAVSKGVEIFVQTIAGRGAIDNVLVELRKTAAGRRQRLRLDAADMDKNASSPEGLKLFSLQLQQVLKLMELQNIQEVLWYLSNALLQKHGLPMKGAEYLRDHLIVHMKELDRTLHQHSVAKAMEKL